MDKPELWDPEGRFKAPRFVGIRHSGPHRIRKGLKVEFEFNPAEGGLKAIWDPTMPEHLGSRDKRRYQEALSTFIESFGDGLMVIADPSTGEVAIGRGKRRDGQG